MVGSTGRGALEFRPDKSVTTEPSKTALIAVATKAGLNKKEAEDVFESIRTIIGNSRLGSANRL